MTCIKWLPDSTNLFLVSYVTGVMYVYNEELYHNPLPAVFQLHKHGEGFTVFTCKSKSPRNPLYKWVVGDGAINQFSFSPCHRYVAVVTGDGYMRVINYNEMTLYGCMRSYFGGLLCVAWSDDGHYVVTGGEDDLITVWSFHEKRVICRGKGHKSWISGVSFDQYLSSSSSCDMTDLSGSEDTLHKHTSGLQENSRKHRNSTRSDWSHGSNDSALNTGISYRIGSVGQDGILCLWEISDEILRLPFGARQRTSTLLSTGLSPRAIYAKEKPHMQNNSFVKDNKGDGVAYNIYATTPKSQSSSSGTSNFMAKFATLDIGGQKSKDKEHKRNFSLGSKSSEKLPQLKKQVDESVRLLGTQSCPRLHDVPLLEAMVCKKISNERLTTIMFRRECIVISSQNSAIQTWARPNWVCLHVVSMSLCRGKQVGSLFLFLSRFATFLLNFFVLIL